MPRGQVERDTQVPELLDGRNLSQHDARDGDGWEYIAGLAFCLPADELLHTFHRTGTCGGYRAGYRGDEQASLGENLLQALGSGWSVRGGGDEALPFRALTREKDGWAGHRMQRSYRHFSSLCWSEISL